MKVFALTFGDENCPSTKYRLIQYKEHLHKDGIKLEHEIAKPFKDFEKLDLKYGSLEKMDAALEKMNESEFKFLNEMPAK